MTQLESSKLSTQTYNFSLEIYGFGGEHTIGTVKNEIAKYWQTDGEEFFEEYMFSWDKPELIEKYSIPEKFQLQDWNELDDLAHLNGPEIMEENTILEVNDYDSSDKISEIVITNEMLEVEDEPEVSEELIKEVQCVYGQAFNKGRFIYGPIESDKPFDLNKLKVICKDWDGLNILDCIWYDQATYHLEEDDTRPISTNIEFR